MSGGTGRWSPKNPTGSVGIYLENSSDSLVEGNYVEGFDQGIVDIEGKRNTHRRNTIIPPRDRGASESTKELPKPKTRRKYFGGFSFAKGDHLPKDEKG